MITNENIVSISQMRKDTDLVMKKIDSLDSPIYLFSRSKIKAVLVNPVKYAEMQKMAEDFLDQQELMAINQDELNKAKDWQKTKSTISKK